MNNLDMIDNRLNNTTCPEMIEALILQRKAESEFNWPLIVEALRQEELRLVEEKRRKEGLLKVLKRWVG